MAKFLVFIFIGIGAFQVADAKNIQLITIGAGNEFWSAFGHSAIAIDNEVYGFGYFSFADENLIQSFVNNEMYYDIGVSDYLAEIDLAEWENRTFSTQKLILSAAEETELASYLSWHNLPVNQSYRYDYFTNNCSTKIRDLLNNLWGGALQQKFNFLTDDSYFNQTFPAKNQSLMNFGLVLGYGAYAYQPRTAWELMALPAYFQHSMNEFDNTVVSNETVIFVAEEGHRWQVFIQTHGFIMVYFVFFSLLLWHKKTRAFTAKSIWFYQSMLGFVLLVFMLLSGHTMTSLNFNVLLFSPMAMLLFKFDWVKYAVFCSYISWALVAMYLSAWYFFPVLLIHLFSLAADFKPKHH